MTPFIACPYIRLILSIRQVGINVGILNACRRVEYNPISSTPAQSTISASHPSWITLEQPFVRRTSPFNLPRNTERCPSFPFTAPHLPLPYARLRASSHTPHICVDPVTSSVRQTLLSPTSKPFHRLPSASSTTAVHIQRELRATPRQTLTMTFHSGNGLRLDAQNPRYCGVSHALSGYNGWYES